MFSLFISFDIMIVFVNFFVFCFVFLSFFLFFFNNFIIFNSSFIFEGFGFLYKELSYNTKMKINFNMVFTIGLFLLLMMFNLMGLVPFFFTVTSQLNFCFFFPLIFWTSIMLMNLSSNFSNFMPHLVPLGSPVVLSQFMVLIESVSQLIRPMTLAIRLMANMTAGHLILILCSFPINVLGLISLPLFLLYVLELMVALIQSYVLVILISMYMGEFNI